MKLDDDDMNQDDLQQPQTGVNQQELMDRLQAEIEAAVKETGKLEAWVAEHFDGSIFQEVLDQACSNVAQKLLSSDPPQTGYWEHLLVTVAVHSSQHRQHTGLSACERMIEHLAGKLNEQPSPRLGAPTLQAIASALTVVLAAQDKLTQHVQDVVGLLCDTYPDVLPEVAEQCQDIWKLRGQMSGRPGLFLWDVREDRWRLRQDFKSYRPTE